MIQTETMPSMETLMDRQKLVGWIVRDTILNSGMSYSEAARRWPMALPTLNRLMNTGNVGLRFYRAAEQGLDLQPGLFEAVIDGDVTTIRAMQKIDDNLKEFIIRELGGAADPAPRRTRRKA